MPLQLARTDELTSVLLVAFAVSVFLVSDSFPSGVGGTRTGTVPAVHRRGIAVLAVIQFIDAVVLRESTEQTVARGDLIRFGIPVALLLGYALVLPLAGFLFTTVGFLVAVMYYSGARDLRMTVPLAFAISVVLRTSSWASFTCPCPEEYSTSVAPSL